MHVSSIRFAWSAQLSLHWTAPILAGIPFGWGNVCLFMSGLPSSTISILTHAQLGNPTYLVNTYQATYVASALAANGLLRYTFGTIFPLFTFQMYSKLGTAWAGSLLAFISLLLLLIPWVLYKWGPFLRSRSSYQTVKT